MNDLYTMIGISKQAHYKRVAVAKKRSQIERYILSNAASIREDHKRLGCRKLYAEMTTCGYGRDKTEQLLLDNGFRVSKKRRYTRTTYSGVHRFANLISGACFNDINQLWVSDITYVSVGYKQYYYLTLIQDVYSRLIVGWQLSTTLQTQQSVLPAYKMAIENRKCSLKGLIFHSDRGSQYASGLIQKMHAKHQVRPSMGNKAWENAHAESLNAILKNEYINLADNIPLKKARKQIEKWIALYNHSRPHGSLKNMKPIKYETFLLGLAPKEKPKMKINY